VHTKSAYKLCIYSDNCPRLPVAW